MIIIIQNVKEVILDDVQTLGKNAGHKGFEIVSYLHVTVLAH